jgi:hypothetical protein
VPGCAAHARGSRLKLALLFQLSACSCVGRRFGPRRCSAWGFDPSRRAFATVDLDPVGPSATFSSSTHKRTALHDHRRREPNCRSSKSRCPRRWSRCTPRSTVAIARRRDLCQRQHGLRRACHRRYRREERAGCEWGAGAMDRDPRCRGAQTCSSMRMARWSIAPASSPSSLIASSIPVASASSLL